MVVFFCFVFFYIKKITLNLRFSSIMDMCPFPILAMMSRPFGIPDPKTFQLFGFLKLLVLSVPGKGYS